MAFEKAQEVEVFEMKVGLAIALEKEEGGKRWRLYQVLTEHRSRAEDCLLISDEYLWKGWTKVNLED